MTRQFDSGETQAAIKTLVRLSLQVFFACVTWLIKTCALTHLYVWHDSFICAAWLIHTCDMTLLYSLVLGSYTQTHKRESSFNSLILDEIHMRELTYLHVWLESYICVTWLIRMCDMTHSYVWHDSFICVTWLIHMCDMTHSYMWHDSFICVAWFIHRCDMIHSHVWHVSFMRVT